VALLRLTQINKTTSKKLAGRTAKNHAKKVGRGREKSVGFRRRRRNGGDTWLSKLHLLDFRPGRAFRIVDPVCILIHEI
jgi:hypothetical protein